MQCAGLEVSKCNNIKAFRPRFARAVIVVDVIDFSDQVMLMDEALHDF